MYWNTSGEPPIFPGNRDLNQWQVTQDQDKHSLVADPLFVDAENGDYRLKPNSPALEVGFQPFDTNKAGRQQPLLLTRDLPPVPPAFP